jgi:hypothetical protein
LGCEVDERPQQQEVVRHRTAHLQTRAWASASKPGDEFNPAAVDSPPHSSAIANTSSRLRRDGREDKG